MKLTKQILKNIKKAFDYFERETCSNAYIEMNDDKSYIKFIIERGNWYHNNSYNHEYTYWEDCSVGFTFDDSIKDVLKVFEAEEKTESEK